MNKMYFSGEEPNSNELTMMDKESWIASRTDNPDKLGRNVWEWVYDHMTGQAISDIPKDTPKDFMKKMTEEFIQKNNLTADLSDPVQLETAKLLMQITKAGNIFQSGYQQALDEAAKKRKNSSTLRDTLKKGSKEAEQNRMAMVRTGKGSME
ncbi:MAG: hypothetical protein ACI4OR_00960 [Alphaproteobacteria bacterium]